MLVAILALSCSNGAAEDTGCTAAYGLTWDGWARGFFTTYCLACHSAGSPDRRGAPVGTDFDTLEDVLSWSDRIQARVLDEQTMPVGGGIPEEDLVRLQDYLSCPEVP